MAHVRVGSRRRIAPGVTDKHARYVAATYVKPVSCQMRISGLKPRQSNRGLPEMPASPLVTTSSHTIRAFDTHILSLGGQRRHETHQAAEDGRVGQLAPFRED